MSHYVSVPPNQLLYSVYSDSRCCVVWGFMSLEAIVGLRHLEVCGSPNLFAANRSYFQSLLYNRDLITALTPSIQRLFTLHWTLKAHIMTNRQNNKCWVLWLQITISMLDLTIKSSDTLLESATLRCSERCPSKIRTVSCESIRTGGSSSCIKRMIYIAWLICSARL